MRSRLLPLVTAGALTLSLLVPALGSASAADPELVPSGPSLPEPAPESDREAATDALHEAQALFEDRSRAEARDLLAAGGADATMALNQLLRVREDLTPEQRDRADALLARPTDGASDPEGDGYTTTEATPVCGDTVCVHYVTTTGDAPPLTDGDDEGTVPDSVDQALATAEAVNDTYVASGYRRPDPDGGLGGRNDKVDIYLSDVGSDGLYGYCTSDQRGRTFNRWAYCVIDDDFAAAQFPDHTPEENQQVTLAHEYYHAVQFAYDTFEDPWILEATATWAEDELFDDVNDNRRYLDSGQGAVPFSPLDRWQEGTSYHYGNWLYFRYLTERWTAATGSMPTIVLDTWRLLSGRDGARNLYSTRALQTVLSRRDTGFTPVYGQFVTANRTPARSYSEGTAYPVWAPLPNSTWTLGRGKRRTARFQIPVKHLASAPLRYRPGSGTGQRDWRLRLKVDMPAKKTAPVARVLVRRDNGSISTSSIRLDRNERRQHDRAVLLAVGAVRRAARRQREPTYPLPHGLHAPVLRLRRHSSRRRGPDRVLRGELPPLTGPQPAASRFSAWRTTAGSLVGHIGGRLARRKPA